MTATPILRRCRLTDQEFEVSTAELEHIQRMSQSNLHLGAAIPLPTVHPLEQLRQICSFVNYLHLFWGQSAISGQRQLTRHNPELGTRICTLDEYWGGAVDNLAFGRNYDFTRPFFDQWHGLFLQAVVMPLANYNVEGSEYINGAFNVKNCYLCFNILNSEDCLYCLSAYSCRDCINSVSLNQCELCSGSVDLYDCYACQDCQDCKTCRDCRFSVNLIGCADCLGCTGLRNAQYALFNEVVGRERYQQFLASINLADRSQRTAVQERCQTFIADHPAPADHLLGSENCTGDYLFNSVDSCSCYFSRRVEKCGYLVQGLDARQCWVGLGISAELTYRSSAFKSYNDLCGYVNADCSSCVYCMYLTQQCEHCFGCVGLRGQSYCILNRQYTKSEYLELVPRIVAHMQSTAEWGETFPARFSPNIFACSLASDIFASIIESEQRRRGYRVGSAAVLPTKAAASRVPDSPDLPENEVLGKILLCPATGEIFSFQKKELAFYRQHRIPPPETHWRHRLLALIHRRGLVPAVERRQEQASVLTQGAA